jgi:beta-lactamase class A
LDPDAGARPGSRRLNGLVVATALAGTLLAGCASAPNPNVHHRPWQSWRTVTTTPPTEQASTPRPTPRPSAPPAAPRSRQETSSDFAAASLDRLVGQPPWHVSLAVQDLTNGRTLVRGAASRGFTTASIAKVDILASLLLERQQSGASALSAAQRALAKRMIEASDNACANQLFRQAGGAWGLTRANRTFGLTSTTVHEPRWGLTTTTVGDQLRLLQQVFTSRSALDASSRAYLQSLMAQVEADQNWGVRAAADGHYALKNGWLPRPDGTWTVNSVGSVLHHGHQLLIAVLTDKDTTEAAGISLTQALAQAAATAVTGS